MKLHLNSHSMKSWDCYTTMYIFVSEISKFVMLYVTWHRMN